MYFNRFLPSLDLPRKNIRFSKLSSFLFPPKGRLSRCSSHSHLQQPLQTCSLATRGINPLRSPCGESPHFSSTSTLQMATSCRAGFPAQSQNPDELKIQNPKHQNRLRSSNNAEFSEWIALEWNTPKMEFSMVERPQDGALRFPLPIF